MHMEPKHYNVMSKNALRMVSYSTWTNPEVNPALYRLTPRMLR
jgi:hypothetical protein